MSSARAFAVAPALALLLCTAACGGDAGGGDDDAGGDGDGDVPDGAAGRVDAPLDSPDGNPAADDPADPGMYGVVTADVSIPTGSGNVAATVYRPNAAGAHPLVIVSPGFQMARSQYASYADHLASWGLVAIAQDFPGGFGTSHAALAAQTRDVIDWALSTDSGLAAHIDADLIGACGHSLGGKISMLVAADDARIGAVVGWDPVDSNSPSVAPERMDEIGGPVAVLGETLNGEGGFMPCAPTDQNFQQFYTAASSPALEIAVNDADHMDWVDDTSCTLCGLCSPAGTLGEASVHRVTRRVTVAWLRRHLLGEQAMNQFLGGDGLAAGLPGGAVSSRSK